MITAVDLSARVTVELDAWDREYEFDLTVNGCKLRIADDGFVCHVEHISVPETARHTGYGTAMLTAVTAWADRGGETLRLHMSTEYGTDRDVLAHFYTAHGFEPVNRIGSMARQPRRMATAS